MVTQVQLSSPSPSSVVASNKLLRHQNTCSYYKVLIPTDAWVWNQDGSEKIQSSHSICQNLKSVLCYNFKITVVIFGKLLFYELVPV